MSDTVTINTRVPKALKLEAEAILAELGLNLTDAVKIFLSQVKLQRGLPFQVQLDSTIRHLAAAPNEVKEIAVTPYHIAHKPDRDALKNLEKVFSEMDLHPLATSRPALTREDFHDRP